MLGNFSRKPRAISRDDRDANIRIDLDSMGELGGKRNTVILCGYMGQDQRHDFMILLILKT